MDKKVEYQVVEFKAIYAWVRRQDGLFRVDPSFC